MSPEPLGHSRGTLGHKALGNVPRENGSTLTGCGRKTGNRGPVELVTSAHPLRIFCVICSIFF